MAYAAVISLKQTIQRLLDSSQISIASSGRQIIRSAYLEVESVQEVLKRFDSSSNKSSEGVNALDGQIREAVCELEDELESRVSDQLLLSHSEESMGDLSLSYPFLFSLDHLQEHVDCFTQRMKTTKEEYIEELDKLLPDEEDAFSLRAVFGGKKSKMVGLSDEIGKVKYALIDGSPILKTVSLFGMAGIGKTTLAKEVFEDPSILRYFDLCAWVTIGQKYRLEEIQQLILAQVNDDEYEMPQTELDEHISRSLKGRTYLIVLDDVWDEQILNNFKVHLPNNGNGSRVLLTTRLQEVADSFVSGRGQVQQMRFLDAEESWCLLRDNVFLHGSCPYKLIEVGKKIAKKCDGLPLTIVTLAGILSEAEITLEYWNEIATAKLHSVFVNAYDQMLKVLLLSYNYLPQHLKACFLYMGVFPQNHVISHSKLINLWRAEGFLKPNPYQTVEDFAMKCLEELVSKSLVIVCEKSSNRKIKTCSLHSVFWHLCNRVGGKNKVFHVLNRCADSSGEGIKSNRRLSIQNSVLFGVKDAYKSMASISTVRSLLCTGPYHKYQVPICLPSRLLRVLDVLAIRFYQFPKEVLELVQLRYFAITYNGKLPASISKLRYLQSLIVYRHLSVKSLGDSSYLPEGIWEMQELKHLEIPGRDLPNPCGVAVLPNLLTLLGVTAQSCTRNVLESIPNLQKLRIQIELAHDDDVPLSCFDHISHLHKLESLTCVIVNPKLISEVVAPSASLPIFPPSLKKLSLSGLGYSWDYISKIVSLPNLEVLKLRSYAFCGPKWEIFEGKFQILKLLLLEDTDLKHFNNNDDRFPGLERLIIRHCYELGTIPFEIGDVPTLDLVELVDCSTRAAESAEYIREEQDSFSNDRLQVRINSSWK